MIKKKYCLDCNKELNHSAFYYNTQRCKVCANKGKLNPNWKKNKTKKYCKDCKKEIQKYSHSIRCSICATKYNYLIGKLKPKKGINNHFYKNGITLQKYTCVDCGKEIKNIYAKRCIFCAHKGRNNPNYIDGRNLFPYPRQFTINLKENIKKRDNYQCQNKECNMTEEEHLIVYGRTLHIHHIDYNKNNCKEDNLITLCIQCNIRVNYNRNYWQQIFTTSIGAIKNFIENSNADKSSRTEEL